MISWLIRRWSSWSALKLQLNPNLERFRARLPYWFTTGLVYSIVILPLMGVLGLAQAMGYRGTPEVSLTRSWLTLALIPPGIMAALGALTIGGRLSGSRPCVITFGNRSIDEMHQLASRLCESARSIGFKVVWSNSEGSFVACRDLQLETSRGMILRGDRFPMRLSLFIQRTGPDSTAGRMKLQGRTITFAEPGKPSTLDRLAHDILDGAGNPQLAISR